MITGTSRVQQLLWLNQLSQQVRVDGPYRGDDWIPLRDDQSTAIGGHSQSQKHVAERNRQHDRQYWRGETQPTGDACDVCLCLTTIGQTGDHVTGLNQHTPPFRQIAFQQ